MKKIQMKKIQIKQIFYQKLLETKNLFIILLNKEYVVTKFEPIDDNFRFYCDEFIQSFSEKFVKIKF